MQPSRQDGTSPQVVRPSGQDEARGHEDDLPPAGFEAVNTGIVCVLTRFGLRRPWHLVQTYLSHRWLMRHVRRVAPQGLLKATFLVEDLRTCYSLSLWADESAIPWFGTLVPEHVTVARQVFGRLRFSGDYPEIWSTKWSLSEVSNNVTWSGFDLRRIIDEQEQVYG